MTTNNLKRFRVRITSSDFYNVDVIAPDAAAAINLAECIDPDFLRPSGEEWKADDAWEVSAEEFEPPELPASSWVYRP